MHDARVFRRSELGQQLLADSTEMIPSGLHLVGDAAYPLTSFLLVPYRDNGRLTRIEIRYNKRLSQNRIVIEHAFALLKNRFRCLQHLYVHNTEVLPKIVLACCLLHNFCINANDSTELDLDNDEHNANEDIVAEGNMVNATATQKRNYIASLLV